MPTAFKFKGETRGMKIGNKLDKKLAAIDDTLNARRNAELEMQIIMINLLPILQRQIPNFEKDLMQSLENHLANASNPETVNRLIRYEGDTREAIEENMRENVKAVKLAYDWLAMVFENKGSKPTKPLLD